MDSGNDPPAPSSKPTSSFKGKQQPKGKLHRRKSSRPTSQQGDDDDVPNADPTQDQQALTDPQATQTFRARVESQGAKKRLTMAELKSELKRTYAQIDASESVIEDRETRPSTRSKSETKH